MTIAIILCYPDDDLTVDAREGTKQFVGSKAISDLDLPWTNLHFNRAKGLSSVIPIASFRASTVLIRG